MNERKRKVIQASLQLFTEKGFQNTSIQDILKHSNISKGTFYNYFSSKNECFMGILEQSRYEASLRRHEILIGQDPADLEVLAQQIAVLFQMNREQNLYPIFERAFHSGDQELKDLLANHRLIEVQWVCQRFTDVFGEDARPYAYECTILFFGMVQHLAIAYRAAHEETLDSIIFVRTALRHIEGILPKMMESKMVLLDVGQVKFLETKLSKVVVTKEIITTRLQGFYARLNEIEPYPIGEQFTSLLVDELSSEAPRYAVVESILKPFRNAFTATSHEDESKELAHMIWHFIKKENS